MRKVVLALCILTVSCLLIPLATAEEGTSNFEWYDDFDYVTLDEMNATGWTLEGPTRTSLNSSSLVISGIGQDTVVRYRQFPQGIDDWSAETKSKWTGGGGGSPNVNVVTEQKSYGWNVDGYYNNYAFSVNGVYVLQFGMVSLQLDQWEVMTMQKTGNIIQLYHNGVLMNTYVDETPIGQALGMDDIAPWQGIQEYDYFSFHAAPTMNWQKTYGGPASDVAISATMTTDGGYAVVGVTKSFGAGAFDAFLVNIDQNGTERWNRTYGTNQGEWTYSVDNTTDGGFILCGAAYNTTTGSFDTWLVKVDGNGELQWSKEYGTAAVEVGFSVVQTSDGGYAVTGRKGNVGGDENVHLLKTDAQGGVQWEQTFGGTGTDWGKALIQTSDGGYAISGWTTSFGGTTRAYLIRTDSEGQLIWEKDLGGSGISYGYGIAEMEDGGLVLSGYTNSIGNGGNDIYAARTDASGNLLWEHAYGGSLEEIGGSVFVLEDGLIFGGHSASLDPVYNRIFVVRTDLNGTVIWSGAYGPDVNVSGSIGVFESEGGFLIIGNTNTYDSGQDDVYVLKVGNTSVPLPPPPIPEPQENRINIMTEATMPVAAVAVSTGIGLIGLILVSKGGDIIGSLASKASSPFNRGHSKSKADTSIKEAGDFTYGYAKGRITSHLFKQLAKVEPEKSVAVQRQPFLAGFSAVELGVVVATSIFLGMAYMMANQINWADPALFATYILVAGLAIIVHDLTHRYVAWKYGAVTEYQFWFLGTAIMFITAFFFRVVYAMPARLSINDSDKLSLKQQAVIYCSGPMVSVLVFGIFMLLVPLGGFAATIGLVGASMNLLSAVYSLMPFKPMDGHKVLRWKWPLWVAMFFPLLVLYFALTIYVF